jgi:AmmeMemoRadiSam system protein B
MSTFMTATLVRHPAVAGRFYPRDPEILRDELRTYLSQSPSSQDSSSRGTSGKLIQAVGCIVPHAGYMYSGHVAGAVFAELQIPEACIVLCPNHTGVGRPVAIMSEGVWETPLGDVPIDEELAGALKQGCALFQEDSTAHCAEHAAEVELPFLQMRQNKLQIVPIAFGTGNLELLEQLGEAIADVIRSSGRSVLIIASSDMNHYESDAVTRAKDQSAIETILRLDPRSLHEVVTQQKVSMCGFGPAIAMLTAARKLGATSAELVKYATSGDVSGDREMVVGYAGIVVH